MEKNDGFEKRNNVMFHSEKTKEVTRITISLVITVLLLDFIFFTAWLASGQVPADGFYLGRISAEIINFII